MKKLLKAPVGVQLSALFLLFMLVLFALVAPWQIVVGSLGIVLTVFALVAVASWWWDN